MPVGFNSAARNLFLLGSSGADLITNFFQRIDQSSTPYNNHQVSGIRYNDSDQKYILSGYRTDVNDFIQTGWVEKRSSSGSLDWNKIIRSTLTAGTIELRALELDNNKILLHVDGAKGVFHMLPNTIILENQYGLLVQVLLVFFIMELLLMIIMTYIYVDFTLEILL